MGRNEFAARASVLVLLDTFYPERFILQLRSGRVVALFHPLSHHPRTSQTVRFSDAVDRSFPYKLDRSEFQLVQMALTFREAP